MASEQPPFLGDIAKEIKSKYMQQYSSAPNRYKIKSEHRDLKTEFYFTLLADGERTAPRKNDYTQAVGVFEDLCWRAQVTSQMPKVIEANHEAILSVIFTANSSDLSKVDVQVSLGSKGIVPVKKNPPPFLMPDFDELRAKVKEQREAEGPQPEQN